MLNWPFSWPSLPNRSHQNRMNLQKFVLIHDICSCIYQIMYTFISLFPPIIHNGPISSLINHIVQLYLLHWVNNVLLISSPQFACSIALWIEKSDILEGRVCACGLTHTRRLARAHAHAHTHARMRHHLLLDYTIKYKGWHFFPNWAAAPKGRCVLYYKTMKSL